MDRRRPPVVAERRRAAGHPVRLADLREVLGGFASFSHASASSLPSGREDGGRVHSSNRGRVAVCYTGDRGRRRGQASFPCKVVWTKIPEERKRRVSMRVVSAPPNARSSLGRSLRWCTAPGGLVGCWP